MRHHNPHDRAPGGPSISLPCAANHLPRSLTCPSTRPSPRVFPVVPLIPPERLPLWRSFPTPARTPGSLARITEPSPVAPSCARGPLRAAAHAPPRHQRGEYQPKLPAHPATPPIVDGRIQTSRPPTRCARRLDPAPSHMPSALSASKPPSTAPGALPTRARGWAREQQPPAPAPR